MDNTQHTGGKWEVVKDLTELNDFSPFIYVVSNIGGRTKIADLNTFKYLSDNMILEAEANARLIAAAPELLEMVQDLKKALARMIDKHDPDSIEAEWIGNAHELILKATK